MTGTRWVRRVFRRWREVGAVALMGVTVAVAAPATPAQAAPERSCNVITRANGTQIGYACVQHDLVANTVNAYTEANAEVWRVGIRLHSCAGTSSSCSELDYRVGYTTDFRLWTRTWPAAPTGRTYLAQGCIAISGEGWRCAFTYRV